MAIAGGPEILPPRWKGGAKAQGGLVRDENLDLLSHLLDDFIRIPGTPIRFGLDGILGVVPGVGDILGGLASTIIILAAWARGVPKVTLVRMVSNVGIEVLVGAVPVLGDVFDIAWRANRRNYALLEGSMAEPTQVEHRSWIFFVGLCAVLLILVLLPLVFLGVTVHLLDRWLGAAAHR